MNTTQLENTIKQKLCFEGFRKQQKDKIVHFEGPVPQTGNLGSLPRRCQVTTGNWVQDLTSKMKPFQASWGKHPLQATSSFEIEVL